MHGCTDFNCHPAAIYEQGELMLSTAARFNNALEVLRMLLLCHKPLHSDAVGPLMS